MAGVSAPIARPAFCEARPSMNPSDIYLRQRARPHSYAIGDEIEVGARMQTPLFGPTPSDTIIHAKSDQVAMRFRPICSARRCQVERFLDKRHESENDVAEPPTTETQQSHLAEACLASIECRCKRTAKRRISPASSTRSAGSGTATQRVD